jgi:hypothetical protein
MRRRLAPRVTRTSAGDADVDGQRAGCTAQLEALQRIEMKLEALQRIETKLGELNTLDGGAPEDVKPKNRGGRSRAIDWDDFFVEVIRLEFDAEGIHSRQQLERHMEDWATATWTHPPNLRTIREKVAKIAEKLNLT